ncbi:MAG: hypothetical protein WB565_08245 [Acidimicrobiales bacterium]
MPLIAVGSGSGGRSAVTITRADGSPVATFNAFPPSFSGGVTLALDDVNGDGIPDLVVGAGPGGGPEVKVFNGADLRQGSSTPSLLADFFAFAPSFSGGVTLAAADFNGSRFSIAIFTLPPATPGTAYGPVALSVVNLGTSTSPYVTTEKWKKVAVPKGLKLSKAGVLSGTPSPKLSGGPSSVTVEVTETVTTLNVNKKVLTKTTIETVIPLTVSLEPNQAAQSNLQTALTGAKTYYYENNQSYTGLDNSTYPPLKTTLTFVGSTITSSGPSVISLLASNTYVVLAAWGSGNCWSIIDNTGSSTLEGVAGPDTIYVTSPAVTEAECSAATFNSASKITGAMVSYTKFPKA